MSGSTAVKSLATCDGAVQHHGVHDRSLPVDRVRVLVDEAGLDHEDEAVRVTGQDGQGRAHHVDQIRLLRELRDGALAEELPVEDPVHVAGVEEAEELRGRGVSGRPAQLAVGRDHAVAGVAIAGDVVHVVLAPRAGARARQEVGRAAAHQDLDVAPVEHVDDRVVVAPAAGVRDHPGRGRVLDLGVGHHADGHPRLPLGQAGDRLHLGIVEGVGGPIGVYAQRVDARLVAGGVGAHRIRGIRDHGVDAGGPDQRHVRHGVHGELAVVLALGDPLREDARGRPVRHAHPVADEQDHVPGLGARRWRRRPR